MEIPAGNFCKRDEIFWPNSVCCWLQESGGRCERMQCPAVSCTGSSPVTDPGTCCPHCPPTECEFRGRTIQEGRRFALDCKECMCSGGNVTCLPVKCTAVSCSHPTTGRCCPSCTGESPWQGSYSIFHCWQFRLTNRVNPRLIGAVGARNFMGSSFSQRCLAWLGLKPRIFQSWANCSSHWAILLPLSALSIEPKGAMVERYALLVNRRYIYTALRLEMGSGG